MPQQPSMRMFRDRIAARLMARDIAARVIAAR